MYCKYCGEVDEHYDENDTLFHNESPKHICNQILERYKKHRATFSKNRDGILIFCNVDIRKIENANGLRELQSVRKCDNQKIRIYVKPKEEVKFIFSISNNSNKEDMLVVGIQCAHPQQQFISSRHPHTFGNLQPYLLKMKTSLPSDVSVMFTADDIGQFEMPIVFTFQRISDKKDLIFVREMVVMVQENEVSPLPYNKSPYTNEHFERADHFIRAPNHATVGSAYKIPRLLKIILPRGIEEGPLEGLRLSPEMRSQLQLVIVETRAIFDEGLTKSNYVMYFRHLLWWEECIARINLRKYNMAKVMLQRECEFYTLEVPGLSENRPSLMRGDRVLIGPHNDKTDLFETVIKDIADNHIILYGFDDRFNAQYRQDALFDVRFVLSLVPFERTHDAVSRVHPSKQLCRIFPEIVNRDVPLKQVQRYYNKLIEKNSEQKSAVRHILSGTSAKAPYMVFGPPGTGKTMTIIEAIIQIVVSNARHRVLVCTDSNMAADHIALMLLPYNKILNIDNYIFRANSQNRVWNVLPPALKPISNGTSYDNFYPVSNSYLSKYRIVVTTLLHSAKYASQRSQAAHKLVVSHLFIDEAAQASEPAALVPITGLLGPNGQLVLAGDPLQLGPVCTSKEASMRGLGTSLMARLKQTFENMYDNNSKYITMLVKNFRSHPDILKLPNELFYENNLQAQAKLDPLSELSILGSDFAPGGERAIVFHAVNSKEQRMGKSPSYFNEKELDMLKRYVKALINTHNVLPKDIGIIAPYIRQVYKMKAWLQEQSYTELEIGTVEAFQGKEKRVILVSTVRANCKLLDYDAKYGLGFLVDDKRFNVTLTRAKSKLIIIGNHACLERDAKWRKYMGLCEEFGCYFGQNLQQLKRTAEILNNVAKVNFDKFRISEAIKKKEDKDKKK